MVPSIAQPLSNVVTPFLFTELDLIAKCDILPNRRRSNQVVTGFPLRVLAIVPSTVSPVHFHLSLIDMLSVPFCCFTSTQNISSNVEDNFVSLYMFSRYGILA